jgi:3-methyl-2-oxobutanoate hydroxymethyltransferase
MGHVGLTPQSVNRFGGYRVQGRQQEEADDLVRQASRLEALGCFAIVLECVPAAVGACITGQLSIPTIGIGAGPETDGQILVLTDLWGVDNRHTPKFVRQYVDGEGLLSGALDRFDEDVKRRTFPGPEESYT